MDEKDLDSSGKKPSNGPEGTEPLPPKQGDPSQTRVFPIVPPVPTQGPAQGPAMGAAPPPLPEMEAPAARIAAAWQKNPWLFVIGGCIVLLLLIALFRRGSPVAVPQKTSTEPVEATQPVEEVTERTPLAAAAAAPKALPWQYREVGDDQFLGRAPIPGNDAQTVLGPEKDAEIAAILQALKNRAEIMFGVKTARWRNGTRKSVSGSWLGMKIQSDETQLPDQEVLTEITVATPAKGTVKSKNNLLLSIKNSDEEKFKGELTAAGIGWILNPAGPVEGSVVVRLEQRIFPEVSSEFLIDSESVGSLKVGAPAGIEKLFPATFNLGQKKVLLGKKFYFIYKIHDEQQNPLLFVYEGDGRIMGISPISDKYRTARGIGIGSSLAEMLAQYSQVRFGFLPGKRTIAQVKGMNIQFFLDEQGIDFQSGKFLPEAKIESILIGEAPVEEEK